MGEISKIQESMVMGNEVSPEVNLRRLILVCIAITAGISGIAIMGWMLDMLILAGIRTDYIPMALSTALLFILLSGALFVHMHQPASPHIRILACVGVILVLLISLIILIDFFNGMTLDIERFLITSPEKFEGVPIGRMSPITAANFILAGSALLLLLISPAAGGQRARGAAAFLATLEISLGFVVLLGYLYGTPLLYGGTIIPVALTTSLVFVFLGIGIMLAAGQQYWPLGSFMGSSVSARLLRVFLPVTIALALITSFLDVIIFQNVGNHVLVSSIVTILSLVILGIIIPGISHVIGSDIDRAESERKLAQKALIKEKEFTEIALDSQLDTFFVFDLATNKAIRWNKTFRDITGYTDEEIASLKAPNSYYSPEDMEKAAPSRAYIMHNGKARFELSLICKDGQRILTEYQASIIRDENGEPKYIISIGRDITERKQAEEALRESEARARARADELAALMDALPTITFIAHDPECRRMTSSRTALRLLRLPDGANTSKSAPQSERPNSFRTMKEGRELRPEELPVQLAAATGQDVRNCELKLLFNDGTSCDILGDAVPLFDAHGKVRGAVGAFLDITERKHSEEALQESERVKSELIYKLNEAQVAGKIGIWEWNLQTNQVWWSDETYRIFGVIPQDYIPSFESNGKFIHPDDYEKYIKSFEHCLQTGEPLNFDIRIFANDGRLKHCNAQAKIIYNDSGQKIRFIGTFMDITGRKRAEEELQKNEERLRVAIKTVNIAVFNQDTDLRYTWMYQPQLGYTENVVGKTDAELLPPQDSPKIIEIKRRAIESGQRMQELVSVHTADKTLYYDLIVEPVKDERGTVIGLVGASLDITERKMAEEELKKYREHLEEMVKERTHDVMLAKEEAEHANMAKTKFLDTMSHELRTPLNAIIGFSEILKQKTTGELNEKQERFINNIITGGNNLHNVISQILDAVKIYDGTLEIHLETIPVHEIVDEAIGIISEKAAKKNVLIEKNLDPDLEYIEADKQKFKQVFINLLENAVKFSKPEEGTVTINVKKEGDMAKFSVSDRGIGIKKEDMEKIFQKFTQLDSGTSRKYGGAGIGLAITKELVELHGGRIWVESKYGEGSTFTFLLPIEAKKSANKNAPQRT